MIERLKLAVNDFELQHIISEIILLGEDGAIRRIIMGDEE